jgi:Kef-type K+ transport system membrane component KefB
MPLKITYRGKYLGVALFYLGIMGILQTIFIVFGQYLLNVGSVYILVLVPLGVIIALTYSTQILYESNLQIQVKRSRRSGSRSRESSDFIEKEVWRPIVITLVIFVIFFFISYGMASDLEAIYSFIVAEIVGGICVLIAVSILENQYLSKLK